MQYRSNLGASTTEQTHQEPTRMEERSRFSNTQFVSSFDPTSPLSNTKPITPSLFKSKPVFLHEWWLAKPQNQREGLAVGGVASMERERVFLSAVVAKRHEANVLETEDGITVVFRGFINTNRTCENGFPSEVYRRFLVGFPHDWKRYSTHNLGDEYINGVSGVSVESQTGNPVSCTGFSGRSMVESPKTPIFLEKDQSASDPKEKHRNRQEIIEDTDDSCSNRVARSISKRGHTMLVKDKKAKVTCLNSPVRRSPRLNNYRK